MILRIHRRGRGEKFEFLVLSCGEGEILFGTAIRRDWTEVHEAAKPNLKHEIRNKSQLSKKQIQNEKDLGKKGDRHVVLKRDSEPVPLF
jgi:hypothetical protein